MCWHHDLGLSTIQNCHLKETSFLYKLAMLSQKQKQKVH